MTILSVILKSYKHISYIKRSGMGISPLSF